MSTLAHIRLLASYNSRMNVKVYDAAAKLPAPELALDRGAFFKSIIGTLNHIVVADIIWLKRFAAHPARHHELDALRATTMPVSLDQILFTGLGALREHRAVLDSAIECWAAALTAQDLEHAPSPNIKGVSAQKHFGTLLIHFFNHQTHHRGQAGTLLFQAGQDIGVTDLLALIPDTID